MRRSRRRRVILQRVGVDFFNFPDHLRHGAVAGVVTPRGSGDRGHAGVEGREERLASGGRGREVAAGRGRGRERRVRNGPGRTRRRVRPGLVVGSKLSRHLSLGGEDPPTRTLRADGRAVRRLADPVGVPADRPPRVRQLTLALVQRRLGRLKRSPRPFHRRELDPRPRRLLLRGALRSLGHLHGVPRDALALLLLPLPLLVQGGDLVEDRRPGVGIRVLGVELRD